VGNRLTDDAFYQTRKAGDDLAQAMADFRQAVASEINDLVGQVRGEQVITEKQARFQAMQTPAVREAISDCHWAAERVSAFGMLYQCAMIREEELIERHNRFLSPSDI
jgi:hypothetical protein